MSDFLEPHRNYFPELEEQAEALRRDFKLERLLTSSQLIRLLEERFGYRVQLRARGQRLAPWCAGWTWRSRR